MITITKLKSLGKKTMLRKAVLLLKQMELDYHRGVPVDPDYLGDLCRLIRERVPGEEKVIAVCGKLEAGLSDVPERDVSVRSINTLRYVLQDFLGVTAGDWDFYEPTGKNLDVSRRRIFPFRVYLDDIRSPFNVGSIFRTADSFGIEKILLSPFTAPPTHRRAVRTSMGCTESIESAVLPPEDLIHEPGVFALELGGVPIDEFVFPREGIAVIGSEELGVGPEALAAADRGFGRVGIPLFGTKGSLNVSVAFGILMYAWSRSPSGAL